MQKQGAVSQRQVGDEQWVLRTVWGLSSLLSGSGRLVWRSVGSESLSLSNSSFQHLFFCSPLLLGNFHCFSVPPLRQPGRSKFPLAGPTLAAALFCQARGGRVSCRRDTWQGPCQQQPEPISAHALSYVWCTWNRHQLISIF